MPRYFIAIPIPDEMKATLLRVQPPPRSGVRLIGSSEFHLTLHFLGELSEANCQQAIASLEMIRNRSFEIQLSDVGTFPPHGPPHVLWAGVREQTEIHELHTEIGIRLCKSIGFQPETRPFHPHVTLARINSSSSGTWLQPYLESHQDFESKPFAAGEFSLYSSDLTGPIPQYQVIEHFPLRSH